MSARGFTLVELLVAAALALAVSMVVVALSLGMGKAFDSSIATTDLTARARAVLAALSAELRDAGSGVVVGAPLQDLPDIVPLVLPRRSLAEAALAEPFTAITIVRATGAQGSLRDALPAGSALVPLDPAAPSRGQDGTAGFRTGDTAMILDRSRADPIAITGVDPASWTLTTSTPVRVSFAPGAIVAGIEYTTYGLRADAAGNLRLVRRTGGGAEQPLVDYVTRFEIALWGIADPPRPAIIESWFPTYGPLPPLLGEDDGRDVWPAGENCTLLVDGAGNRAPRLASLGPAGALVPLPASVLSDGPWCPDAASPDRFDADLLRVRRIDVEFQLEPVPGNAARPPQPVVIRTSVAKRQG